VIEHIPNPLNLLRTIAGANGGSRITRLFFETPAVDWIFSNRVIWDFFYEHCSYFTSSSLTTAFQAAGFHVQSVRRVFGDQYLWLEASNSPGVPAVTRGPGVIPEMAQRFAAAEATLRGAWEQRIHDLSARGRVALWGAGAKGATLANLVDPECRRLACVVDLNPAKQGHFLSGTGHPIVGYEQLPELGVRTAILMNPNYREENLSLLRTLSHRVDLVELDGATPL
jgi:hypothetical protein